MPGIVRAGIDLAVGVCYHPGTGPFGHPITCMVTVGSPLTTAENIAIARMTDITENSCIYSKTGIIISGSIITKDSELGVARAGDIVQFTYGVATFVQGSTIVTSD